MLTAAAGYPVCEDQIIKVPWVVMMTIAWVLEWEGWTLSFGKKEHSLNRARVKYTTIQRALDITKRKGDLGTAPR